MALFIAGAILLGGAFDCEAAKAKAKPKPAAHGAAHKAKPTAKPTAKPAPAPEPIVSTICVEAQSGLVLAEQNADLPRPPASMAKMMLFLLVMEGVHNGKWTLDTPVTVTKHAQGMGGTQVYLEAGEVWTVRQLAEAAAVVSANDAAMALAEGLWGSEDAYKAVVNKRAAELGMLNSTFNSVHGLPPDKGKDPDATTARDMARLGQFCVADPQILEWVSKKELQFKSGANVHSSTNKMLWRMSECDGIKTGYTRGAGFCVTATASRDGIRLIAVVMGCLRSGERFDLAQKLLEDGFAQVRRKQVVAKGEKVGDPVPVADGEVQSVQLIAADDLWVIVKENDLPSLRVVPERPAVIRPPIQAGTAVGEVSVQLAGKTLGSVKLTAPVNLNKAGWLGKAKNSISPRSK